MGKLINRIPGSRLLISSLPGSALRTHVKSLGKPPDVNKHSQTLPDKLDIERHSPSILYVYVSIATNVINLSKDCASCARGSTHVRVFHICKK